MGRARKLTAAAVATALMVVPTGAIASTQPAPSVVTQQAAAAPAANPWLTLSAMTTTSGAANAAALQDDDGIGFPPLVPLAIILATIALAIWILLDDDDDDGIDLVPEEPVSP